MSTTADDAAQWRHITEVTPLRQANMIQIGNRPVGRIKLEPVASDSRAIDAYPRMGGIRAPQPRLTIWRFGQQVAAYIPGCQPHGPQAANHDVRKILTDAFSVVKCDVKRRVYFSRPGLVLEICKDPLA